MLCRHQPLDRERLCRGLRCSIRIATKSQIARQIRAASPIASPNRLIVSLADRALGREGRMLRALDEMGPGSMMVEGHPFRIELD